jgi:hypothetical protein
MDFYGLVKGYRAPCRCGLGGYGATCFFHIRRSQTWNIAEVLVIQIAARFHMRAHHAHGTLFLNVRSYRTLNITEVFVIRIAALFRLRAHPAHGTLFFHVRSYRTWNIAEVIIIQIAAWLRLRAHAHVMIELGPFEYYKDFGIVDTRAMVTDDRKKGKE